MDKKALQPGFDPAPLQELCGIVGGQIGEDAYGPQWLAEGGAQAGIELWREGVVSPLPDLGLVSVSGADALNFLQGQLTNEVEKQGLFRSTLNGYCSAKGRLLVSTWHWQTHNEVRLLVSRPLAAAFAKRLSMFVMRAKAVVTDRSADFVCLGLAGGATIVEALGRLNLTLGETEDRVTETPDGLTVIVQPSLPLESGPIPRALLLVPRTRLAGLWSSLTATLRPLSSEHWRWSEVASGIPRITAATSELFVPQMVNFDLVGGVSFKKGCYPGQEVVARSHYLGKLKRRMFLGSLPPGRMPQPGEDVESSESAEPCGQVVLASVAPGGDVWVLFESQVNAAASARIGDVPLTLAALPYALPQVEGA
jgi:folate-binding protein YgfZ